MKKLILLTLLASVFVYFSPNAGAATLHHAKSHHHAVKHKHHRHHKRHH